ncbi:hypothetical protein [Mycoplasma sp. Z1473D]
MINVEDNLSNLLRNNKIVVHGSYALKMLNLLNRKCNDIDLLIIDNINIIENNKILDFFPKKYNFDFYYRNEFIAKTTFCGNVIEFMQFKNITEDMIINKEGIKFLKPKWIFVFKICQLFTSKIIELRKGTHKNKIIQTIDDLNYLLEKLNLKEKEIIFLLIKAILINLKFEIFTYYTSPYLEIYNFESFLSEYLHLMSNKLINLLKYVQNNLNFKAFTRKIFLFYQIFNLYLNKKYLNDKCVKKNFGYCFLYENINTCINDLLFLNKHLNNICVFKALKSINQQTYLDFNEIISIYFDIFIRR